MVDRSKLETMFSTLAEVLLDKHQFTIQELRDLLDEHAAKISVEAFHTTPQLTPLEVLTRHYSIDELTSLIGRQKHVLENSLESSTRKHPQPLILPESTTTIPVSKFADAHLSMQEVLVMYLHEQGKRNNEIADLLGKDPRVIATVLGRARKKRGEQQ